MASVSEIDQFCDGAKTGADIPDCELQSIIDTWLTLPRLVQQSMLVLLINDEPSMPDASEG